MNVDEYGTPGEVEAVRTALFALESALPRRLDVQPETVRAIAEKAGVPFLLLYGDRFESVTARDAFDLVRWAERHGLTAVDLDGEDGR